MSRVLQVHRVAVLDDDLRLLWEDSVLDRDLIVGLWNVFVVAQNSRGVLAVVGRVGLKGGVAVAGGVHG